MAKFGKVTRVGRRMFPVGQPCLSSSGAGPGPGRDPARPQRSQHFGTLCLSFDLNQATKFGMVTHARDRESAAPHPKGRAGPHAVYPKGRGGAPVFPKGRAGAPCSVSQVAGRGGAPCFPRGGVGRDGAPVFPRDGAGPQCIPRDGARQGGARPSVSEILGPPICTHSMTSCNQILLGDQTSCEGKF